MAADYHHGDLPSALRAAAVELIADAGPNGFSLREVARRAGVSHAAPAHHFGDTRGLLTSVASEGFRYLSTRLADAANETDSPRDRFMQLGEVYIETALSNPGHYGVMIGHDYTDEDDEELLTASMSAYAELLECLYALRDEYSPTLSEDDISVLATLAWSSVHGLVELSPTLDHVAEVTETPCPSRRALVEQLTDMVILAMQQHG